MTFRSTLGCTRESSDCLAATPVVIAATEVFSPALHIGNLRRCMCKTHGSPEIAITLKNNNFSLAVSSYFMGKEASVCPRITITSNPSSSIPGKSKVIG